MQMTRALLICSALLLPAVAGAHGDAHPKKPGVVKMEQKPWGISGNARSVRRTIEIQMTDNMRFTPDRIEVRQGDTIRFILPNGGKQMHEFVLGTKQELDEHAALMKKFPKMEHDEPYMAHVSPASKGEIIWTFNRTGDFFFACLLPGHYDAGMVGTVRVVAK
ncbi:MAG: cupredoxin family protein [Burkholderiales bacterium]|nr:cupredoxin family protein [Burkholderiales bacterium]